MTGQMHPEWLKLRLIRNSSTDRVACLLEDLNLGTVCQSAHCPNIHECFGCGTATFMILGQCCTRNCRFCAVECARPEPLDTDEPQRVAEAVRRLNLNYVVVTSVTRDDLEDGGAGHFANTIRAIRETCPGTKVEILVPDLRGSRTALKTVCMARPDMFNHNIETVPRLYPVARPEARFERSLSVLKFAARQGLNTKSGVMLGMGESAEEIAETLSEILATGCEFLTLGQYLAPSKVHLKVDRYVQPREFDMWATKARTMGFKEVASGPLVRSSYKAEMMLKDRTLYSNSAASACG
jgi:lipoic acid synthetase